MPRPAFRRLIERGHTDCKYNVCCATLAVLWQSTVYMNSKCRERLIQTWKRVVLAFTSAASQQGHGTAVLASHAEPGAIPESLSRNNILVHDLRF